MCLFYCRYRHIRKQFNCKFFTHAAVSRPILVLRRIELVGQVWRKINVNTFILFNAFNKCVRNKHGANPQWMRYNLWSKYMEKPASGLRQEFRLCVKTFAMNERRKRKKNKFCRQKNKPKPLLTYLTLVHKTHRIYQPPRSFGATIYKWHEQWNTIPRIYSCSIFFRISCYLVTTVENISLWTL